MFHSERFVWHEVKRAVGPDVIGTCSPFCSASFLPIVQSQPVKHATFLRKLANILLQKRLCQSFYTSFTIYLSTNRRFPRLYR